VSAPVTPSISRYPDTVPSVEELRQRVLQQRKPARLVGDIRDHLRHQTRLELNRLTLGRSADRLLQLVRCERRDRLDPGRQQLAEPRVHERSVVVIGPEGHDHPEPAGRIERGDPQRLQHQLALALVGREREQLLELVHEQDELRARRGDTLRGLEQPAGAVPEEVAEPRRRARRDPHERRLELVERMPSREQVGDEHLTRVPHATLAERGHQPGPHDGGLAAAARPDHGQEAGSGNRLLQPRQERPGQRRSPEEVPGVGLGERAESFIRVAFVAPPARRPGPRLEGTACDLRDRLRCTIAGILHPVVEREGERPGHLVPEELARQVREGTQIVVGLGRIAVTHAEVGEGRGALSVEQDVRGGDVAVRDPLPVGEPERGGHLLDHPQCRLASETLTPLLQRPQAAAAHVPRDEVRPAGLTPVVVDRDDVRVLERRDELGLALEPQHERGVRGDLLVEHLHDDVSADVRLDRAEHHAESPRTDPLQQPIPAQGLAAEVEAGVLPQDPLVKLRELR
jgi:hypothetical protein